MSIETISFYADEHPSTHERNDDKSLTAVTQSLNDLQLDDAVQPLNELGIEGSICFDSEQQLKEFLKSEAVTVHMTRFIGAKCEPRDPDNLSLSIAIVLPNNILIHCHSITNLSDGELVRFKLILKQLLSEQISPEQVSPEQVSRRARLSDDPFILEGGTTDDERKRAADLQS
jgi:hypothetical protein